MTAPVEQIEDLLGIEAQFFRVARFDAFSGAYDWGDISAKDGTFECNCENYGNVCCHVDELKAHLKGIKNPRAIIKKVLFVK